MYWVQQDLGREFIEIVENSVAMLFTSCISTVENRPLIRRVLQKTWQMSLTSCHLLRIILINFNASKLMPRVMIGAIIASPILNSCGFAAIVLGCMANQLIRMQSSSWCRLWVPNVHFSCSPSSHFPYQNLQDLVMNSFWAWLSALVLDDLSDHWIILVQLGF